MKNTLKKLTALLLAVLTVFALCSCGKDGDDREAAVVDIEEHTAPPVTAAPTPDPTPTPEPTPEPTPGPTPAPTDQQPAITKPRIYLTFDDGPYKYTDDVLSILAQYNVKATFFSIGTQIIKYPEQAKHIAEQGHCLACHSYSHEMNQTYASLQAFTDELARWRQTVIDSVGYDAGAYVLRFPGGTTNTTINGRKGRDKWVQAANAAGYHVFDWNMGINDRWLAGNKEGLPKIDYFWKSYLETYAVFKDTEPLILIIHDTEPVSVELLPRILDDLISKGFSFGTLDELDENYLM